MYKTQDIDFYEGGTMIIMTREEMFMRGYKSTARNEIDSIKKYNEKGQVSFIDIKKTRLKRWYYYKNDGTIGYIIKDKNRQISYQFDGNKEFEIQVKSLLIEGRIGTENINKFNIKNISNQPIHLTLQPNDVNIKIKKQNIVMKPNESHSIILKTTISELLQYASIKILNKDYEITKIPVIVNRIDLSEKDFYAKDNLRDNKALIFKNQNNLIIKLKTDEKFLNIYQKDVLVHATPISKLVNEVDISQLKQGKYTLEIINFTTGIKKYCIINK